jgi:hypothetical protein
VEGPLIHAPRLGLCLSLALGLTPLLAADKPAGSVELTGKVMPLGDALAKHGVKVDADQNAVLVLVTDDGKVYPLVKDDGSRLFYKDKALLNRPMKLTGKFVPGSQLLQVKSVQSLIKGVPHEVYYWCDICSIKRGENMICECCGGPMDLREDPVKK